MQETYRCPDCNKELPTLAAVREHVNKDHAKSQTDGRPPERVQLTEEEERAAEEQEVEQAEEDMERGEAAFGLESQKWV
jgi:hypothetical protein